MGAGLAEAPSVLLTTNDDAMDIHLAVYCRRLNPGLRIVSRITRERNSEAIHRAGADFVLSYASLGAEAVMPLLRRGESVILGGGLRPVLRARAGEPGGPDPGGEPDPGPVRPQCAGTAAARRWGCPRGASTVLATGGELVMLGSKPKRRAFTEAHR